MIKIQEIDFPSDCKIVNNDFYNYDPENAFKVADNLKYLNEDLLQCAYPVDHIIIDLGWYGNRETNSGEYRVQVIMHENWEVPFNTTYSKSTEEVKTILTKVLHYFSRKKKKQEPEIS